MLFERAMQPTFLYSEDNVRPTANMCCHPLDMGKRRNPQMAIQINANQMTALNVQAWKLSGAIFFA